MIGIPEQALAVLLLAAVVAILFWFRRHGTPGHHDVDVPERAEQEAWDAEREVRQLLASSVELQAVHDQLGYSLTLEWQSERLLDELKNLIRVEIPDYAAFCQVLEQTEAQADDEARYQRLNDPLLREVMAAKHDRAQVLEILNRDPVGEALPFVEQIPFKRRGEVIWRTPIELEVLRKRPHDVEGFDRLLKQLGRLVRGGRLRRSSEDRDAVLESIARAGRDLRRNNAYTPTSIQAIEAKLDTWLRGSRPKSVGDRRDQLHQILAAGLELKHRDISALPGGEISTPGDVEAVKQQAQKTADTYRRESWMHARDLTHLLLDNLLASELAVFSAKQRLRPGTPGGVLAVVRAETAAGRFDPEETERRLHGLESQGFYVHSLVYALLRFIVQ